MDSPKILPKQFEGVNLPNYFAGLMLRIDSQKYFARINHRINMLDEFTNSLPN